MKKSAYTLLELIVTIIIIAILAGLAIPRFGRALETARGKEAKVALEQIRSGERIYRSQEGSYYPSTIGYVAGVEDIRTYLNVSLTEGAWTYTVTTTGPDDFIATATRQGGTNDGEAITIDNYGDIDESNWSP